jgi:transposase
MGKNNTKDKLNSGQERTNQDNGVDYYDLLSPIHQRAVDLKLNGMKNRDIAAELKVKEKTVRNWFAHGGLCYDAYKQLKRERRKEKNNLFKEIDERLKDIAVDAVIVLENAVRKGNWKAAVKVLEMAGFEPVHKVADVTDDEKQKTLQLLKDVFSKYDKNRRHRQTNQPVSHKRRAGQVVKEAKGNI